MPILVAGNLGGRIRTGRVLRYQNEPYNNLLVSLQNAFGISASTFGEPGHSSGGLPGFV
jgi:hypothetical protein